MSWVGGWSALITTVAVPPGGTGPPPETVSFGTSCERMMVDADAGLPTV